MPSTRSLFRSPASGRIQSQPVVRAAPGDRRISLAELRPKEDISPSVVRDKRTPAIEKIDVNDLRKTLNEALEERKPRHATPAVPSEEVKEKEEIKTKNVIKPGDTVKF